MDIVKKNLLSIICGAVALLAIIAIFFPIGGLFADLQTQTDASAANYKKLEAVKNKPRVLPILNPRQTEAAKLDMFPNQTAIKAGEEAVARRAKAAETILDVALNLNRKEPLVAGALPQPDPTQNSAFKFREIYRQAMNADADPLGSEPAKLMRAGLPPTPDEVESIAARTRADTERELLTYADGQPNNADQVEAVVIKKLQGLTSAKQLERARSLMIYAEREAFAPQPQITGSGGLPDATAIFNAQTMLWTQDEVARAIAGLNKDAGATSVLDAPAKHLIALDVPTSFTGAAGGPGGARSFGQPAAGADGAAATLDVDAATEIKPAYAASPTGRPAHTALYDVVRFPMTLRVDATRAPLVINGLMNDRLLTVTNVDVVPFDAASARNNGYVYGDAPVIELHLQIEMLFLRKWLAPLMPEAVKTEIAAMSGEEGTAGATAAPAGGSGRDAYGGRGGVYDPRQGR